MKNDRLFARAIESERVLDTRDKRKMIGGHFPNRRIESGRGLEILSNCDRNSSREEIPTRKKEREGRKDKKWRTIRGTKGFCVTRGGV